MVGVKGDGHRKAGSDINYQNNCFFKILGIDLNLLGGEKFQIYS